MTSYPDHFELVLPALQSKCSEFHYFQYDTFTEEDLWEFCVKKKWRKKDISTLHLYEMINDIMDMTASDFLAYHQVEALKKARWNDDSTLENIEHLLRPSPKKTM